MLTQQLIENTKIDKDRINYYIDKFAEIQEKQKKYQESKKNSTLYQNEDLKEIKNIALMGPYGSGKSTILNALKDTDSSKYINISMMEFADEVEKNKKGNQENKEEKIRKVEQSIIQQLIYQVPQKTIPYSKLKKEYPSEKDSKFRIWLLAGFIMAMILFLIFRGWSCIISFNIKSFLTWTALALLLFLVSSGVYLLNFFLYYIHKNYRLSKITTKSSTIIELNKYESVYNYFLDELIYFFKYTSYDTVIFEDIDRYNDLVFFSHLRELNTLLNNSQYLGKPITFIYAVREDIFVKQDKHKFFDAMITVKPILAFTNALQVFKEYFKNEEIEDKTLEILSEYMFDMRAIKNLVEEYHTYLKYPNTPAYKKDSLLAILVLKNLYPQEYAKLQENQSVINKIFQHKEKIIKEIKQTNAIRKEYLSRALNDKEYFIDPKYSILGLLKDFIEEELQNNKIYKSSIKQINIIGITSIEKLEDLMNIKLNFDNIANIRIVIEYRNTQHYMHQNQTMQILLSEYLKEQIKGLVDLQASKQVVQSKTKTDIAKEIKKLNLDSQEKVSTYYNSVQAELDKIFEDYKLENHNGLKIDENFILFIRTLILNDLIDEEYGQYIFKNYEKIINQNDREFIRNFYAKIYNDFNLKIFDIEMIYEKLKDDLYTSVSSFNYDIILFLSKRNPNGLKQLLETIVFKNGLENHERINLLYSKLNYSYEKLLAIDGVKEFVQNYISLFIQLLIENQITTEQSQDFYTFINNEIKDENLLIEYYKLNPVKIDNTKIIKNDNLRLILSQNIDNAYAFLEDNEVGQACKIEILRELDIEIIKSKNLQTFEIINKFDLYDANLLSTEIYEILIKNMEGQENKNLLLAKVLNLISNENDLKRMLKTYDTKFNRTKKEIPLDKTELNEKIINKIKEFELYDIREENEQYILSKNNTKRAV